MSVLSKPLRFATRIARRAGFNERVKKLIRTKMPSLMRELSSSTSDDYPLWVAHNFPDGIAAATLGDRVKTLENRPTFSIIVGVYNTDPNQLSECLDSIRSQIYPDWELIAVDDASSDPRVRKILAEYADLDGRIKPIYLDENGGISATRNCGISATQGDFIGFVDHDDLLWPNALLLAAEALNRDPALDVIYTDEDKIGQDRHIHHSPFFKPGWSPDLLLSINYICHFLVIRRTVLTEVSGFRPDFDGAEDWDLLLRVTANTTRIEHIPKICYSWRVHQLSTAGGSAAKPYVSSAQLRAVKSALAASGREDAIVTKDATSDIHHIRYPVIGEPLVSIVIPTKNMLQVLRRCLDSLYSLTKYPNYEVVLVDTGSDPEVLNWYSTVPYPRFRVIPFAEQPFSFAKSCNRGAEMAEGSILVFLNNDTEILTGDWLTHLAGEAQRPEVGSVGARLYYPDGITVQHSGVGLGVTSAADNLLNRVRKDEKLAINQWLTLNAKANYLAVTAACLAIRAEVFREVGGFDPLFRVTYNDVDLGCRLVSAGYRNVLNPQVELLHHESISLNNVPDTGRDLNEFYDANRRLIQRWPAYVTADPYLNPNLDLSNPKLRRRQVGQPTFDPITHDLSLRDEHQI